MSDDFKMLGREPEPVWTPSKDAARALLGKLESKIRDMDRAGDVVAAYNPYQLLPEDHRMIAHALRLYVRGSDD